MDSVKTLSFFSQTQFHKQKSPVQHHKNLSISQNPPLSITTTTPLAVVKLHITSQRLNLSPIPHKPTSKISKSFNLCTKFVCERLLLPLLGAFIFMDFSGFSGNRPSLALSSDKVGNFGEELEEKSEKRVGVSEEEDRYEKVLETDPYNVVALKVVVSEKMKRGKTSEAVKFVERLIDIEPDEVEWRLLEALCYEMMGQFSKAKRLFKDILQERPLLLRALHGLAMVMHKKLEGPAVFEMLSKALEVARREKRVTEERNIRILIAQMHVVKGQLEEGLKELQDLVDENPRDFRPYLCQGIIYSLLDRKAEAAEQFETYQSLVPEEFPQRRFLDDVMLEAQTKSREQLRKDFEAEFSRRR